VRRSALALVVAAAAALLVAGTASGEQRDVSAYQGLGTWVDVYDDRVWRDPSRALAAMHARGVTTLFLETSNYRKVYALRQPGVVARIIDEGHALGLSVVAWYLPSFADLAKDTRRSLAAIRFRTPTGDAFDSFALDIEDPLVRPASLRTVRLLRLSRGLRRAAGPDYPLGAIIPSPRGMELLPRYWPGFPYRALRATYDVFLPMGYFTYRTRGFAAARDYTLRNVAIIRRKTGDPDVPIHAIGGVAGSSSGDQVRGFVAAVSGCNVLGAGLYDFLTTSAAQWQALAPVATLPARC
jgi:hypothetical protein